MEYAVVESSRCDAGSVPPIAAAPTRDPALLFFVSLDNYAAVAAAFGGDVADRLRTALFERATAFFGQCGELWWAGNRLRMLVPTSSSLRLLGDGDEKLVLAMLVEQLSATRVADGASDILPLINAAVARVYATDRQAIEASPDMLEELEQQLGMARPGLADIGDSRVARVQYRFDMACAAAISDQLEQHSLALAWQPITDGRPGGAMLYQEGLLRLRDANGAATGPGRIIEALERLGMVRALDVHVVNLTIDRLQSDASLRLGCNISAQSAIDDGWWQGLFATLAEQPDVAARLVIEITESAAFTNIDLAVRFVDRLRRLGCRIAIDDFGTGHAAFRYLQALKPDIVKIDGMFLKVGGSSAAADAEAVLRNLVGLAGCMVPVVVVEGVGDSAALAVAQAAGAHWLQGYHIAQPSLYGGAGSSGDADPFDRFTPSDALLEAEARQRVAEHNSELDIWRGRIGRTILFGSIASMFTVYAVVKAVMILGALL